MTYDLHKMRVALFLATNNNGTFGLPLVSVKGEEMVLEYPNGIIAVSTLTHYKTFSRNFNNNWVTIHYPNGYSKPYKEL